MDKLSITPFPDLPARVPRTLLPDLVRAFVPLDTVQDGVLELVITIDDENIPVREFAEYLALVDRLYGRMSRAGLMSYAHSEWGRLQINEVNKGSLELIIKFVYEHAHQAIIVLLFLKSLPNLIKVTAESYKTYQEGRLIKEERMHKEVVDRYEEGRLARENRKRIREDIQQVSGLANLDDARTSQFTTLLIELFMEENPRLSAPIRFARRQVKSVLLRIGKRRIEAQGDFEVQSDFMDELKRQ